jgi:uncharacterized membrane protein
MTDTDFDTAKQALERRERYERWFNLSLLVFVGLWFVLIMTGSFLEEQLLVYVGTVSFYVGYGIAFAILYGTDVDIEDERDERISKEAAGLTMFVLMGVMLLVYPPGIALEFAGVTDLPPLFWNTFYAYCALFLLFGACHAYVKRQL